MIVPLSSDRRPSSLIGSKGDLIVFMLGGTDRREQVSTFQKLQGTAGFRHFFQSSAYE